MEFLLFIEGIRSLLSGSEKACRLCVVANVRRPKEEGKAWVPKKPDWIGWVWVGRADGGVPLCCVMAHWNGPKFELST